MKHINQLDPTRRALADQSIRDALLSIVAVQKKSVTIPIETLNDLSEKHRLVVEVDHAAGVVKFTAEKADLVEAPAPKLITDKAQC